MEVLTLYIIFRHTQIIKYVPIQIAYSHHTWGTNYFGLLLDSRVNMYIWRKKHAKTVYIKLNYIKLYFITLHYITLYCMVCRYVGM